MKMEAAFNRRMRKTARTVVWEGAGAQSPAPDPIMKNETERSSQTSNQQSPDEWRIKPCRSSPCWINSTVVRFPLYFKATNVLEIASPS
jgi:hypothetical protein